MLRHRTTGEVREVPIAAQATFREVWQQVAARLGLELVPLLTGGALTSTPPGLIPSLARELEALQSAEAAGPHGEYLADRIGDLLTAFAQHDPADWEYSFG